MIDVQKQRAAIREQLADDDTPAFVLMTIALSILGDQVFGSEEVEALDPVMIWQGLYEKTGIRISPEQENKLQALMTGMEGSHFYEDTAIFSAVCSALYDGDLGDLINGMFDAPSLLEVMWSILEIELAREEEHGPPEFSPAVTNLITEIAAGDSYDMEAFQTDVESSYVDLITRLKALGVEDSALDLLHAEYAEVDAATAELIGV